MTLYKFKICMLGTLNVGKTSLVRQFVHARFSDEYLTTVGVKVDKKRIPIDNVMVDLMLWDIEGPDSFTKLQTSYLRGCAGYFIVVDATRLPTFESGLQQQQQIEQAIGSRPWSLVVNKTDVIQPSEDAVPSVDVPIFQTSAKTGQQVEAMFVDMADRLIGDKVQAAHG